MATTNKKFRVLVVDDSAFMRKVLEGIFNADDQLQVVGNAKDGREAVAMAESLKPDVISMDINMPHVDGLQATAEIMTTNPRPIVIVSSESREGAASTLRALELGAIEFVAKPSSAIDLDMQSVKEELAAQSAHGRKSSRRTHCVTSGFHDSEFEWIQSSDIRAGQYTARRLLPDLISASLLSCWQRPLAGPLQ